MISRPKYQSNNNNSEEYASRHVISRGQKCHPTQSIFQTHKI